ncbi:MAG: DUF4167 domain-containing protein [Rhizobiales bacterium]|nr:DUF4167 domain-containing protein [Hyphomicrobiales bacterium]
MRNGQNNKRMRGRNNNNQHHHHQRRNQNPMSRVYESNGPDVKIRGNPSHIAEKYVQLARDAQSSGDPVAAENYYQHAEHYNRLIAAAQEQFRQQNPQFNNRPENDMRSDMRDDAFEDGDEDSGGGNQQPIQAGGDSPYGTREPQPYIPRETQPFPNQQQPAPRQQQDNGDVDRLPSFITGGQPQNAGAEPAAQGQNGHDGQPDRFPLHRRRRRHRGPRPEFQGGQRDDAASQD